MVENFENIVKNESEEFFKILSSAFDFNLKTTDRCKLYSVKMVIYCLEFINGN